MTTAWVEGGEFFDYVTGARATRMWVADDLETVRGILIVGNGAGADARSATGREFYQVFADLHDFALVGTSYWGNLQGSEIGDWDEHMAALAAESGHPELVNAPWAPIGFSNGGQMSYGFNAVRPEETIAFITNKGCCYNVRLPNLDALKTPGILIAGENDTATRRDSIRALYEDNRSRGGLWSWVEQETVGHSDPADRLVIPFMAEAIRLRYPDGQAPTAESGVTLNPLVERDGWLVDQTTWQSGLTQIMPFSDATGDPESLGWVANENIAFLYRAFSTYDREARILGPDTLSSTTAPFDMTLRVDTGEIDDWTQVELFDYAQSIRRIDRDGMLTDLVTFDLSLPRGVHGLTAQVTLADGSTIRTSDIVAAVVIPEPVMAMLLASGFPAFVVGWRRLAMARRI